MVENGQIKFASPTFQQPVRRRPNLALADLGMLEGGGEGLGLPTIPTNTTPGTRQGSNPSGASQQEQALRPRAILSADQKDAYALLDDLGGCLAMVRSRYYDLLATNQQLGLDLGSAKAHLAQVQSAWQKEKDFSSRAQSAAATLLGTGKSLVDRVTVLADQMHKFHAKIDQVDEMSRGVQEIKLKLEQKLATKDQALHRLQEASAALQAQLDSLEKQYSEMQQRFAALEEEKGRLAEEFKQEQESLKDKLSHKIAQFEDLKMSFERLGKESEHELSKMAAESAQSKEEIRGVLTDLAKTLHCQIPSEFGDSSAVAIRNIINEIIAEHRQNDQRAMDELLCQITSKDQELRKCKESLEEHMNHELNCKAEHELMKKSLQEGSLEIEERDQKLRIFEERISSLHAESMCLKAKLADLQGLKCLGTILEKEILNQSLTSLEYEDVRAVVMEKMDHGPCSAQLASLQAEIETLKMQHQEQIKNIKQTYETKLSTDAASWQRRYNELQEESQKMLNKAEQAQRPKPPTKDKTVENLIELIERDTQEIKLSTKASHRGRSRVQTTPQSATPSSCKRTKAPQSRTPSTTRYPRRSPLSNISDMDLWSAFSKERK